MTSHVLIKFCMVLIFHHVCAGNTRNRDRDDVILTGRRFIFDASHTFTGWASWEQYAACATLCVSGYEKQTKECCDTGNNRLCYSLPWDKLRSHIGTCHDDGYFGAWSMWTDCSTTCDSGVKLRNRTCIFDIASPRGKNCTGDFEEKQPCNQNHCPVDGVWLTWTSWSTCSATCAAGQMRRHRECHFPPHLPQGDNCTGTATQAQTCNNYSCPVDGVWLTWSSWSPCSATCAAGQMRRHRECHFPPHLPQGDNCTGTATQAQTCNNYSCPVDGVWLTWSSWSPCSATCAAGQMRRHRECHFPPHLPQGDNCTGTATQAQTCNNYSCPVDGVWLTWSSWSPCSATCAGGQIGRHRECHFQPHVPQGAYCAGTAFQVQTCNNHSCQVPVVPRTCFQCVGPKRICEQLNAPQLCPLDKQYCINTVNNSINASRSVDMRCGTREECQKGWYEKYSHFDKCTKFTQDYIYTNAFDCEFCCDTDSCNDKVNPDTKWHP